VTTPKDKLKPQKRPTPLPPSDDSMLELEPWGFNKLNPAWAQDRLAIAAILLAVAGLVNYAMPSRTGEPYWGRRGLENPCLFGESSEEIKDGSYRGAESYWRCYYTTSFKESSLPITGVLVVGSLFLLVLRLRPIARSA
jgi:hypothetical protein